MGLQNRQAVVAGVREQARIEGAAGTTIADSVDRTASVGATVVLPDAIAVGSLQHEQSTSRRYAGAVLPPPIRAQQVSYAAQTAASGGDYGAAIAGAQAETAARERGATPEEMHSERQKAAQTTREYAAAIRSAAEAKNRTKQG